MCCNPFVDLGCGHAVASAIYHSQRLALCCAAAAISACLLVTLLITGGVGVGVGYHYCVVESKTYELDLQNFRKKYTQSSDKSTDTTPAAPTGTAPTGATPTGTAPTGTALTGTAPTGTAPTGTAPTGTAPTGTAPTGTAPTPAAPTRSAPTPAAPTGTAPTPAAPTGTVPTGTAPTGTTPTPAAPTRTAPTPAAPNGTAPTPAAPTGTAPTPIGTLTNWAKLRKLSGRLVEDRSLGHNDPQEQLSQKVEKSKRMENAHEEYKRTTWLYKDNADVSLYTQKQKQPNLYENQHLKKTQFKHQRLYSEKLTNKYNKLQKAKSLLLSKLGLNSYLLN